jgi:hypothetical protein
MPIQPPVKAVLRKDLLLGGAAGTALCVALVGAAFTIGPLLGIDWSGDGGSPTTAEANLPPAPRTANPSAEALRAQIRAPRILNSTQQPTTRVAARPNATPPPSTAANDAPSIVGRAPQTTSRPPVTPRSSATGTPDPAAVPAPASTGPVVPPAAAVAAIPATPAVPAPAAKKVKIRVASAAVVPDDNGSPQLRLSLALDRAAASAATVPDAVTVTLRPQLPGHPASTGPLALRTVVDVVDAPAGDNSGEGTATVAGMQMRVRMALAPTASTAPAAPAVSDAGESDGQSNTIAVDVPLVAFADPNDHSGDPAEPTDPGTPPAAPSETTEIRLALAPAGDANPHPATETAKVAAPDATSGEHSPADVPVTVVVDSKPAPAPDPAPAPTPDPAPAPAPDPAPAPADTTPTPAPADTAPAPTDTTPSPTPAYPDAPATTVTAETATPAPDPAAPSGAPDPPPAGPSSSSGS